MNIIFEYKFQVCLVFTIVFFGCSQSNSHSQSNNTNESIQYVRFEENGKYGYKHSNGEIIIAAQYNQLSEKPMELMVLKKQDQVGVVDYQGNIVVDFGEYDKLNLEQSVQLKRGANPNIDYILNPETVGVIAEKGSKYGLINLKGKVVMPIENSLVKYLFNDLYAFSKEDKWRIYQSNGGLVINDSYDEVSQVFNRKNIIIAKNGKYGLIELPNKIILECEYDNIIFKGDGKCEIVKDGIKSIYILGSNKVLESEASNSEGIEFEALAVVSGEKYNEELFIATKADPKKMGLYNSKREELIPIIYDGIFSGFVNPHYVSVSQNRHSGLFDLKGNQVCEIKYNGFVLSPSDPTIIGAYLGSQEKWRVIDNKGKSVFSEDFTKIQFLEKDLVILQNDDFKCSLASIKGELITEFEFELLQGLDKNKATEKWYVDNDIVATAFLDVETIYINSKGKLVKK